jgi:CRISPR-associated endonuclease/helicase Cas3
MISFEKYFQKVSYGKTPRAWQLSLASQAECVNRFIHAGTGLGKTLGVGTAWAYHRLIRADELWPRRLVWCLPMRVLVEQTADELRTMLDATQSIQKHDAGVSVLMGGIESTDWHLYPDRPAVLIGTQDMLLSRALNRGYASGRAKWPMEFALLNQDVLWIFDEVQLQGVGAVTGTQLQAFRQQEERAERTIRPAHTWWMSATLRSHWLETVDSSDLIQSADDAKVTVPKEDQAAPVFTASKPVSVHRIVDKKKDKAFAESMSRLIQKEHAAAEPKTQGRVTLVVMNTVDEASIVFQQLQKDIANTTTDLRLIHSRFRGREKANWRVGDDAMLSRVSCEDKSTDRIIVSTQVVEAGVDISASCLVTELAPWASLVQRFGRAARYGGLARVVVVDRGKEAKDALPYDADELAASLEALNRIRDVGLTDLAKLEEQTLDDPDFDQRLFRFEYINQLQRYDLDELFDTSSELTGEETDISRFIREGDDVNVQLCWFRPSVTEGNAVFYPPTDFQPSRDDLCSAPVLAVRDWLTSSGNASKHRENCSQSPFAFWWSFDEGSWQAVRSAQEIQPGQTLLLDYRVGGYDIKTGFTGSLPRKDESVVNPVRFDEATDSGNALQSEGIANTNSSSDALSQTKDQYQSIGEHGSEVAVGVTMILGNLVSEPRLTELMDLAARLHDYGKCHPVFRGNISVTRDDWSDRDDIAKAPQNAWRHPRDHRFNWPERSGIERFKHVNYGQRIGFRHELASALGLIELLYRAKHPAVIPDESLAFVDREIEPLDEGLATRLRLLGESEVNLLLYLIATHHGKVRGRLQMTEQDQDYVISSHRLAQYVPHEETNVALVAQPGALVSADAMPVRGVRTGDQLSAVMFTLGDGTQIVVPPVTLCTDLAAIGWSSRYGRSWTDRMTELQQEQGPFRLAMLETVLRAADIRVSRGEQS